MTPSDGKGYRLIPAQAPRRQRTSFYADILDEFDKSGEESVAVEGTGRNAVTLVQGLRKALQAEGMSGVEVIQRGGVTFLVRRG